MKKGQVEKLLPALIVPMLLIVFAAIFASFTVNTQYTWEQNYANESVTITANIGTVAHPPIKEVTAIYNATGGGQLTESTDYNVTDPEDGKITFGSNVESTVKVTYTGHGGTGWEEYGKIKGGTWGGFKLASLIPYIIIAVIVLGVLLTAVILR